MAIIKCSVCDKDIEVLDDSIDVICKSCGTGQFPYTLPDNLTDKYILNYISKLDMKISDCERASDRLQSDIQRYTAEELQIKIKSTEALSRQLSSGERYSDDSQYTDYQNSIAEISRKIRDTESQIQRLEHGDRVNLLVEKTFWEGILAYSPAKRLSDFYYTMLDFKNRITSSTKLQDIIDLARQFNSIKDYKDSKSLAMECAKMAVSKRYDLLVSNMSKFSTKKEFDALAEEFLSLKGYKDSDNLFRECIDRAIKAEYDQLMSDMGRADTAVAFSNLADRFRGMGTYRDSKEQINICEERAVILYKEEKAREEQRILDEAEKERQRLIEIEREKDRKYQEHLRVQKEMKLAAYVRRKRRRFHLIGRFISIVIGIISIAIFLILTIVSGGSEDSSADVFLNVLHILPLLVLSFSSIHSKVQRILFTIIGGIWTIFLLVTSFASNTSDIAAILFKIISICNIICYVASFIFPKDKEFR